MTDVLLDSHVVVWALTDPGRLSEPAREALASAPMVHVSAASLYELEFKRSRRRGLETDFANLPLDLLEALQSSGLTILPISPTQTVIAARLPIAHGDPWDRILIAQARDLGVPLISQDRALHDQAGDTPVIW